MSMRHLLLAAVFLAHPLVAGATHVVSPPVRPGPGDAVVCQLLNIGTSTIEHIDVQIRDFAGDPTGDSVFDGSIDDGGTFELKSRTSGSPRWRAWPTATPALPGPRSRA